MLGKGPGYVQGRADPEVLPQPVILQALGLGLLWEPWEYVPPGSLSSHIEDTVLGGL